MDVYGDSALVTFFCLVYLYASFIFSLLFTWREARKKG